MRHLTNDHSDVLTDKIVKDTHVATTIVFEGGAADS